jgi:hypothetical protein
VRLRKITLAAAAALALFTLSAPAGAAAAPTADPCQARKGDACRFYVFDPSAFEGSAKGPGTLFIESDRGVAFEALHRIKPRSFMRALLETSRMNVFK